MIGEDQEHFIKQGHTKMTREDGQCEKRKRKGERGGKKSSFTLCLLSSTQILHLLFK